MKTLKTYDALGREVNIGDRVAYSFAGSNRIRTMKVDIISKGGQVGSISIIGKDRMAYIKKYYPNHRGFNVFWVRGEFILYKT